MLKTIEDISATRKRLTIEIPADTIEKEIQDSLQKVRQRATLPGFRPGKAPMDMIERRFGKSVEAEVLDRMIPEGYMNALKEADISPVSSPVMENKIDFKRQQPIHFSLTLDVAPKIILSYDNLKVKDIPVSVEDKDIEDILKRHQEEKATYEPSEGPIGMGDLTVVDFSAAGVDEKDKMFRVGDSLFPADVSEKLVGKSKGDELSFDTGFPEDYPQPELAGKSLTVKVSIKDVKKITLPAVDDDLAKDSGFSDLGDMKKHIGDEILKAKKNEVSKIQKGQLLGKLIETHEFEVPESLVEQEAAALAAGSMPHRGQGDPAEKDVEGKDIETLKKELRPNAVRNVKASLLVSAIGKENAVTVTDEDMKKAVLSLAQRLSVSPENIMKFYVSKDGSLDGLKNSLFEEKVLELMLSKAEVEKEQAGSKAGIEKEREADKGLEGK